MEGEFAREFFGPEKSAGKPEITGIFGILSFFRDNRFIVGITLH